MLKKLCSYIHDQNANGMIKSFTSKDNEQTPKVTREEDLCIAVLLISPMIYMIHDAVRYLRNVLIDLTLSSGATTSDH